MVTAEWDIPFALLTPQGTLPFNEQVYLNSQPLGWYILNPAACNAGRSPRVTRTNIAQGDGEVIHRKFTSGYVMELSVELWQNPQDGPACDGTLRKMVDHLMLHLNSIENSDGAIQWTPSGTPSVPDRMLDHVRILGPTGDGGAGFTSVGSVKEDGTPLVTVTFALLCPFPYANDTPMTDTYLTAGSATHIVNNDGSVDMFPVFNVRGAFGGFHLTNYSNLDEQGNPKVIAYLGASLPGGQSIDFTHYCQIETFRNTAYKGVIGGPANLDNLLPGIDLINTDFWTLVPGENEIGITGANADMFWAPAWA